MNLDTCKISGDCSGKPTIRVEIEIQGQNDHQLRTDVTKHKLITA